MIRSLAVAMCLLGCATAAPKPPVATPAAAPASFALPFVEDDWDLALARAKSENKPLFIDVWAPWCHTCLSLKAYVFSDARLAPFANRFVFLAIDGEKAKNAKFMEAHPIEAWPTLFVVDPKSGATVLQWIGGATVSELTMLLEDAEAAVAGKGASVAAVSLLIEAERARAAGKKDQAREAYRKALAENPTPDRRARIVDGLVALLVASDPVECASLAKTNVKTLPSGTAKANVALNGLACAEEIKDEAAVDAFVSLLSTMVADESSKLLADDRSSLYEALVEHAKKRGDGKSAKTLAKAWALFLENEANKAKDASSRAVFDAHRVLAYVELGDPARAIPMLEASEQDLPNDYNPPARLARVHLLLGRLDEARAAIGRALGKAYGPRKLRLHLLAADIEKARGDVAAERAALDAAVALGESLPLSSSGKKLLEQIKARRGALDAK